MDENRNAEQNLSELCESISSEMRLLGVNVYELARQTALDISGMAAVQLRELLRTDFLHEKSKKLFELFSLHGEKEFSRELFGFVDTSEKHIRALLAAEFCDCLFGFLRERKISPSDFFEIGDDEKSDDENDGKIAYLKNSITDKAYEHFSKIIKDARAVYGGSFSEVCEQVYYGGAKYCILPIENTNDGILPAFLKLIGKYELCAVMSYKHADSRLVCLCHALPRVDFSGDESVRIDFHFPRDDSDALFMLTAGARYFAAAQNGVYTMPSEDGEGSNYYFSFSVSGKRACAFAAYLKIIAPSYYISALYKER